MLNIYQHEIKMNLKSAFWWAVGLSGIIVLYMALYPGISKDAESFTKIIANYPASLRQALGISLDTFTSIIGLYAFTLSILNLGAAVQAMFLGMSLLAKEMVNKTADFLLTKPISRTRIVSEKLLAGLTLLGITEVLFFAIAFISLNLVKTQPFSLRTFGLLSLSLPLLQLIFLALGFLIATITPKIKALLSVSLSAVLGFFVLGMTVSDSSDPVRYLTPFKYVDVQYILLNRKMEVNYLIAELFVIVAFVVASYVIYSKRDIDAV